MELKVDVPSNLSIDLIQLQKMTFVYNALDAGWSVKKIDNQYIFSKKLSINFSSNLL